MKKILFVLCCLFLFCSTGLFAFGIGVQGGYAPGSLGYNYGNAAVTFALDSSPYVFAAQFIAGSYFLGFGITGDYWFFNKNIAGPLNWFLGGGAYVRSVFFSSYFDIGVGGRLPIGLNAFFANSVIELYLQVAPSIGLGIRNYTASYLYTDWGFPINFGIRFWIK